MSEAAFSLLSLGLSFKGVKKSEKELFKKGSAGDCADSPPRALQNGPEDPEDHHRYPHFHRCLPLRERGVALSSPQSLAREAKAETKSRKRERQGRALGMRRFCSRVERRASIDSDATEKVAKSSEVHFKSYLLPRRCNA